MLFDWFRSLHLFSSQPKLSRQEREELRILQHSRIEWMDPIIHQHMRMHADKMIAFMFHPEDELIVCQVFKNDQDGPYELQLGRAFHDTDWDTFWPLLTHRIQRARTGDVRIQIISTPEHPRSECEEFGIAPYLVECLVIKRKRWRSNQRHAGFLVPDFA